jgi:hypothetical protein
MFNSSQKKSEYIEKTLVSLRERESTCWDMAGVFFENKDAHGIHDMGVEIQALQRTISEFAKMKEALDKV